MSSFDILPGVCNVYRFDSFEVHVRERILLRGGKRIKLQELPFRMLVLLLEHCGETVSREELRDRLWGQETFVEVDKGLYVVAAKLREALRDPAARPRLVRTVSGRGYLFIGKVVPVFDPPSALEAESILLKAPADEPVIPQNIPQAALQITEVRNPRRLMPSRMQWSLLGLLLLLGTAAICIGIYRRSDGAPSVGQQDSVVVGGFANTTGDSDLDGALSSTFQLKLQESPYLNIVPDSQFRRLVENADTSPLKDQLRACTSLRSRVLLNGKLSSQPQGYRILLSAWRCGDGELLASAQADAASQSALLSALDLAAIQLRKRLGEPGASVQKFNVPSIQATTGSIAALKAFTVGEEKRFHGLKTEALAAYRLAVDLDPLFALAYARLGAVYTNLGEMSLSRQYYKRAFDLRDRTTDRERLYIVTHYYSYSTGETGRAIEDYQLWRTLYPRDVVPANNLALAYLIVGEPDKAVGLARSAVQLDPLDEFPYATLAAAYSKAGDYTNLATLCNDSSREKTDILGFHESCFDAAFTQDDSLGMQRQMQWASGNPMESRLVDDNAWAAVNQGRLKEGLHLFSMARKNSLQNNLMLSTAGIELDQAIVEAELGFPQQAESDALGALKLAPDNAYEKAMAALVLARAGKLTLAQSNMKAAAAQAPSDTILNSAVLASVRATVQLQEHNPQLAIQSLAEARPFDFCESMGLALPYYRGLAYLQDNKPNEAAQEFQRTIDHRAIGPTSLYLALAQLELGHSLQLTGDRERSQRVFAQLNDLWKNADPDFPPLQRLRNYESQLSATR